VKKERRRKEEEEESTGSSHRGRKRKKEGDVGDDRLESRRIGATSEPSAALLYLQTKSLLTSSFSLLYFVIY